MDATGQTIFHFLILVWAKSTPYLRWGLIVLVGLLSWGSALHALLNKRESRAAFGWVAFCIMFPVLGPALYFLFGINRVHTRGRRLGSPLTALLHVGFERAEDRIKEEFSTSLVPERYRPFANLSDRVTKRQLLGGNRIEPLENGEEAYPAMLEAIESAQRSLYLSTYIMDSDAVGRLFIAALAKARERGVDVRVILDGVGELYSFPWAGTLLKRAGVPVVRFLPPRFFPPSLYINLRNHCKILVVDDRVGFTGGMNIGERHLAGNLLNTSRVEDIHFRVFGPVVTQMEEIFLAHWSFCTGAEPPHRAESLGGNDGDALCRSVVDGPNEDMDKLALILVGATAAAQQRVFIMTPYFLPSRELIGALQAAVLRGVDVRILLSSKNNLPYVKWASDNMLWQLLEHGVRVFYQPPPFVHSKLFLVDDFYCIIGSANMDPRSLRLNFELALEIFDPSLNKNLEDRFMAALSRSRETSLAEMDGRSLPVRIRDSLCWLFSPYL